MERVSKKISIYITVFIILFMLPYMRTASSVVFAIDIITCDQACLSPGDTQSAADDLEDQLKDELDQAECDMKEHTAETIDDMVQELLETIQELEEDFVEWWKMFWYYDFRPSLQDMTGQWDTALVQQSRVIGSFIDAEEQNLTQQFLQDAEMETQRYTRPSEQICVSGTNAGGGFARITAISRGMRDARERERIGLSANKKGTNAATGNAKMLYQKWDDYVNKFCDVEDNNGTSFAPLSNFGAAGCTASGTVPDTDILVEDLMFEELTINVLAADIAIAAERIVENLIEPNVRDPFSLDIISTSTGHEHVLNWRSDLARRGVARTIPDYIMSLRMPGSEMDQWVTELRQNAGVDVANISTNPSYKEIMYALTFEKFTTGQYGLDMVDDPESVAKEKMVLSGFYLMQLRDYYELLERIALSLAVQVAVQVDEISGEKVE